MYKRQFLIKGWSVTLVAALLALAAGGSTRGYIFLAYFPIVVFWYLDGYYLSQERLFRRLYDRVRQLEQSEIDFSMNTSVVSNNGSDWMNAVFSKTLLSFYPVLIVSVIIVMFWIFRGISGLKEVDVVISCCAR